MARLTIVALAAGLLFASTLASAQRVRQQGNAIVEFSSPQVKVLAAYEYSRRHHAGAWLLVEAAFQSKRRVAIEREQIHLVTPDERKVPLASQEDFLDDHQVIRPLLQNATVWRRPLGSYFNIQPVATIRFFSYPGRIVHDSFVSNPDEVAAGDLFFKSPDGQWPAGDYRLVVTHPEAMAELPMELE